jgi:hypothetical protein
VFKDIPADKLVTYVNPVCVEKRNDDGSIKFRTRLTIGGDRIQYPYDTTAVTADLEALKILLNCMISENANFSTLDLTDFYLGTDLPQPEYIRIPTRLIPADVLLQTRIVHQLQCDLLFGSQNPLRSTTSGSFEPTMVVQASSSQWILSHPELSLGVPQQRWLDPVYPRCR